MGSRGKTDLISTVIGAVLALAVGTALSLVLNGFVKGFLVMGVLALVILLFIFSRDVSAHHGKLFPVHRRNDTRA